MTRALPPDLREAVVRACGSAFHYKSGLRPLFTNAGVSGAMFDALQLGEQNSKFVITREILSRLDGQGQTGRRAQWRIVAQLVAMRGPLPEAPDQKAGSTALDQVRTLAKRAGIQHEGAADDVESRRRRRELEQAARAERETKKSGLRDRFAELSKPASGMTPQARGYAFEDFLKDLFGTEGIAYRPPYRVGTVEQIDGAFKFGGRDYLVEARWRKDAPEAHDLYTLAYKVEGKLDGTLGLFITMSTPRADVVNALSERTKRVLIMDGSDLACVLQGLLTLRDALEHKAAKAAQEGVLFWPVAGRKAA